MILYEMFYVIFLMSLLDVFKISFVVDVVGWVDVDKEIL